ncbi:MAG: ATP-dependent DNA helicase UvrD2 [archaeon]
MEEDLKYTHILKALMELPFQVGRNLLCDFLTGDYSNKSISKSRLDELDNFDSLSWSREKVFGEIDRLISNGMIDMVQSDYNKFVKVMQLTIKGRNEITHPTLEAKRLGNRVEFSESKVSDSDREVFAEFGDFLEMYNDEQRKAIVSPARNLLCVAGAGSGKTTVLTKRIQFLVRHRGVDASKILAITFTRKARLEMERRLKELGVFGVKVHTFNSFCEGILQKHGARIYGRQVRVQSYGDKILAMNMALANLGLNMDQVVDEYFNAGQKKFRTASQLANAFMNDCFAVMDYFKVSGKSDYDFSKDVDVNERVNAERIYRITKYLKRHMESQGLRDYSDQIIDAVRFFREYTSSIPEFEHVLVDEYQDVNALQIELIGLLKPKNLFAVGDPRQSIFGWRGSDVSFILNFEKDFGDAEIVHLKKNYRSLPGVVDFMNHAIRDMKLPDLESHLNGEARIKIMDFANEDAERDFVLREIEDSNVGLDEIFVLARTNKILLELSRVMSAKGIVHFVRADESNGKVNGENVNGVTLATIHAIKGLEAKKVFVIGANEANFPCKATDHPAVEMVKMDDYDREEEERRLFYVAVSRAREELIITHTRKLTYYVTDAMRQLVGSKKLVVSSSDVDEGLVGELKSWRSVVSEEAELPAYCVLSNKTIEEIADLKPKSAEELIKVSGIGPEKLMRYGAKILEIVSDFGVRS